jgi:predicted acylesterase/phospholipase RssA
MLTQVIEPGDMAVRAHALVDHPPAPQKTVVAIANHLMAGKKWMDAASVWWLARQSDTLERDPRIDVLSIAQQAHCLSKEKSELRLDDAFKQAVDVLEAGGLGTTTDPETLGIAGGIYKRYWEAFRQRQHLEQAFDYYQRRASTPVEDDAGYTAINAAYVADVLAHLEETVARRAGTTSASAAARRIVAQGHRQRIVDATDALKAQAEALGQRQWNEPADHPWWIQVTLAEAHFGLGQDVPAHYDRAGAYLRDALRIPRPQQWDWMIETTARQLGAMARMQDKGTDSRPWDALAELIETHIPGLRTELGAKVGLALSGGGFRASLYHIGVLARLAEIDMLRHVEVISCVSGGSIVGAMYYLRLRDLLRTKQDEAIEQEDYVTLVSGLERDFLDAIQRNNFRMRMLESFTANLQMLTNRASRTEGLGRIMAQELYGSSETRMDEIRVEPPEHEPGFLPVDYNWRRKNKVPLLVLNATNQAGGHPWHFTPYEMGEPQLSRIDANAQIRRRPYADEYRAPHVWQAVSASACVPVLFEPICVNLGTTRVNLLDGGVHDNQGTSALLDRDCTLLVVSDASGQLADDPSASTSLAAVGLRASDITQERLRIALYEALEARQRGSLLRGMLFLHLRLKLGTDDTVVTEYGIATGIQRRLSAIRTDLDVFNDAEALSLMVSGYQMASQQFAQQLPGVRTAVEKKHRWAFSAFEDKVKQNPARPRLLALLDAGSDRFLKAWKVVPILRALGSMLIAASVLGALWLLYSAWQSDAVIRVSAIASAIVALLIGIVVERLLHFKVPSWKREVAFVSLALTGSVLARVHSCWIDRWYLRTGARDRV